MFEWIKKNAKLSLFVAVLGVGLSVVYTSKDGCSFQVTPVVEVEGAAGGFCGDDEVSCQE